MRFVPLTQGKVALVDDEDYEVVAAHKWSALRAWGDNWYAVRMAGGRFLYLHRVLLGVAEGEMVDHKDGDGLNNQRSNLRRSSALQNSQNQRLSRRNKSGFKGVFFKGPKWMASIRMNGRSTHLGMFDSAEAAALAYDAAAAAAFGEFARLNFPDLGLDADDLVNAGIDMELRGMEIDR